MTEVHVIGDTNIDHLKWLNPDQAIAHLTKSIKMERETRVFIQMVKGKN